MSNFPVPKPVQFTTASMDMEKVLEGTTNERLNSIADVIFDIAIKITKETRDLT